YGHPTTIERSRQENPANHLRHCRTPSVGRGNLWTLQAPAGRAKRGPGHDLAGRSETRAHAAGSAWVGDAGARRHPVDPGADGLASGTLGIASWGYRQARFHHYGTERPNVTARGTGR